MLLRASPVCDLGHGESYAAVSRLPWLTALHAFPTCGTWTRGYRFAATDIPAEHRDLPIPFTLEPIAAQQFETARRRGWAEAPDSPSREAGDAWDERRNARMIRAQPNGHRVLRVESLDWAGGEFGPLQAIDGLRVRYALEDDRDLEVLDDLQWADWDAHGRLLVATRSGRLQIRILQTRRYTLACDFDLAALTPEPSAAPDWAQRW